MKCEEFVRLIDALIDGELDLTKAQEMQFHAQNCDKCAHELRLAEQLRDMLRGMDDDIVPPLAAQAAWRDAVKAEARSRRMRRLYKICGSAAAAVVLMVGCVAGIRAFNGNDVSNQAAPVEADSGFVYVASDGDEASPTAHARTLDLADDISSGMTASLKLEAEDPMDACDSIASLAVDCDGYTDAPNGSDTSAYIVAYIPADNFDLFIESLDYVGAAEEPTVVGESGDSVMVNITIKKN